MEKKLEFTTSDWIRIVLFQLPYIFLPIWAIHDFYFSDSRLSKENPVTVNILIVVFILMLVYVVDNFSRFRKFAFVPSLLKLEEKTAVVESLEPVFKWLRFKENAEPDVYEFMYWRSLKSTITILLESDGFYINVMDTGTCWLLDFWYYRYMTKKVKAAIEAKLTEHLQTSLSL